MDLSLSGLVSGFDWGSLVDQLAEAERLPQRRLLVEQNALRERNNAYGSLVTQLGVLRNRSDLLGSAELYAARTSSVGDATVATATVANGAREGSFTFSFQQLASASRQVGAGNRGASLNASNDVSALVLAEASFAAPITDGTLTVNGQRLTISNTDTLQDVFDQINTATGGAVSGSYDAATDVITLAGAGEIVLGSATDTSNFFEAARLRNNGTGTVSSSGALGAIDQIAALSAANFATPVTVGGGGTGLFRINGVDITYDLADTAAGVLKQINDSEAGVQATYDSVNDRFVLTNQTTGDVGMALEDVDGNFLAATGLLGGSLERGKDLIYTVNGGGQLTSHSNTVAGGDSGLTGVTVTALQEGKSTTVSVTADTDKIKTVIKDFLEEYNKLQSMIDAETASETDDDGKVTAGTLANDREANELASSLRSLVYGQVSGLPSSLNRLEALGVTSNGYDDQLSLSDESVLDGALATRLSDVRSLFTDASNGLAVRLDAFIERTVGDEGSLTNHKEILVKQASDIDQQIVEMERIVQANREQMVQSFIQMESAQARVNQQLDFLSRQLSGLGG